MSDLTSSFRHAAASLPFREIKSEGSVRDHGDYHDFRALKHVPTQEALKFSRHAVTLKERLKAVENFIKRVRPEYETVRSLLAADAAAGVAAVMWSSAALLGMSGHSMTDVERDTLDKEVATQVSVLSRDLEDLKKQQKRLVALELRARGKEEETAGAPVKSVEDIGWVWEASLASFSTTSAAAAAAAAATREGSISNQAAVVSLPHASAHRRGVVSMLLERLAVLQSRVTAMQQTRHANTLQERQPFSAYLNLPLPGPLPPPPRPDDDGDDSGGGSGGGGSAASLRQRRQHPTFLTSGIERAFHLPTETRKSSPHASTTSMATSGLATTTTAAAAAAVAGEHDQQPRSLFGCDKVFHPLHYRRGGTASITKGQPHNESNGFALTMSATCLVGEFASAALQQHKLQQQMQQQQRPRGKEGGFGSSSSNISGGGTGAGIVGAISAAVVAAAEGVGDVRSGGGEGAREGRRCFLRPPRLRWGPPEALLRLLAGDALAHQSQVVHVLGLAACPPRTTAKRALQLPASDAGAGCAAADGGVDDNHNDNRGGGLGGGSGVVKEEEAWVYALLLAVAELASPSRLREKQSTAVGATIPTMTAEVSRVMITPSTSIDVGRTTSTTPPSSITVQDFMRELDRCPLIGSPARRALAEEEEGEEEEEKGDGVFSNSSNVRPVSSSTAESAVSAPETTSLSPVSSSSSSSLKKELKGCERDSAGDNEKDDGEEDYRGFGDDVASKRKRRKGGGWVGEWLAVRATASRCYDWRELKDLMAVMGCDLKNQNHDSHHRFLGDDEESEKEGIGGEDGDSMGGKEMDHDDDDIADDDEENEPTPERPNEPLSSLVEKFAPDSCASPLACLSSADAFVLERMLRAGQAEASSTTRELIFGGNGNGSFRSSSSSSNNNGIRSSKNSGVSGVSSGSSSSGKVGVGVRAGASGWIGRLGGGGGGGGGGGAGAGGDNERSSTNGDARGTSSVDAAGAGNAGSWWWETGKDDESVMGDGAGSDGGGGLDHRRLLAFCVSRKNELLLAQERAIGGGSCRAEGTSSSTSSRGHSSSRVDSASNVAASSLPSTAEASVASTVSGITNRSRNAPSLLLNDNQLQEQQQQQQQQRQQHRQQQQATTLLALEQENATLVSSLAGELDEVLQAESRMQEVAEMMSVFTHQLAEQQEDVVFIAETTQEVEDDVDAGHSQLVKAAAQRRVARHIYVTMTLLLSAVLIFLDFIFD